MVDVDEIESDLDKYFKIKGSIKIDPSTGVVDVDGDVDLIKKIKRLPVKFGTVSGYFYCYGKHLISLSGSPRSVGGDFDCYDNQLTSLVGAPDHVGGSFYCFNNQLTSLAGAPDHVGGYFDCGVNDITSLEGAPARVGRDFICYENKLTSLEGLPAQVGGSFVCTYSKSLPVLRLMVYPTVHIYDAPPQLNDIINKYKGQGKPGALKAAAELIRAGYKENARW